jgi:hypothetical protein
LTDALTKLNLSSFTGIAVNYRETRQKPKKKASSRELLAFFFGMNQGDCFVLVDAGNKSRNA